MKRRERREWKRNIMCGRNRNWLPLSCPQQETWSVYQACALTGNWTSDLSVCRLVLNHGGTPARAQTFVLFFFFHSHNLLKDLVWKNCNGKKYRFGCLLQQKPNLWGRCWCKRKEVCSGAAELGRIVDSHFKARFNLSAQAQGSYRYRNGRAFFPYPIIFLVFDMVGTLSIHISSFWHAWCKNLPLLPSWPMGESSQHVTYCLW